MTETKEKLSRLDVFPGVWLAVDSLVHMGDLMDAVGDQGRIVRVRDINAVKFVPASVDESLIGCVAGWISEDEPQEVGD